MDELMIKKKELYQDSNLLNYELTRQNFSWGKASEKITGLPDGKGVNIAYEAIDRHVLLENKGDDLAIKWISKEFDEKNFTYKDLYQLTNKFANALEAVGLNVGDRMFGLCPRLPELYIGVMGCLKAKGVFSPLFPAFGPDPIQARMEIGAGQFLLTTEKLYKRKVEKIRDSLPDLKKIILLETKDPELYKNSSKIITYEEFIESASPEYTIKATDKEDPALLHFTSGTTGKPKGALHVHGAVLAHHITGQYALDLKPDCKYWCTADPGWVTGTSYGIIAPLTNAVTMIVDEADFNAERWYEILQNQKVEVWYTAPTAIRMLMKFGKDLANNYNLSHLKFIASVGEPLNPEAIRWGKEAYNMVIHDNWWQTETGGIMMANFRSLDVKPGSMGKPMPGIEAALFNEVDGENVEVKLPNVEGQLAIKAPWPSMFREYIHQEERYKKCFTKDGWYLSGDLAKKDEDGYFWFVGRMDDVIKTAGHLIGPFEVESALIEHDAVAEAAVIGIPDETLMNTIKAFITLNKEYSENDALKKSIMGYCRKKLGPAVAPRELQICASLPKTRSGKIMRRLLKARELGLPEGDTSTLEKEADSGK